MDVKIRESGKADIPAVQDVAKKTWNSTYEGIIPEDIQNNFLQQAYSEERMDYRINHTLLLVAEADGKIVGFANYSLPDEKGAVELGAIYIYPEHQGSGIGTALLEAGMERLEGVKEIFIEVEKDNTTGRTFYEAKGFQKVDEYEDNFGGHLLQTIRMVWRIPGNI